MHNANARIVAARRYSRHQKHQHDLQRVKPISLHFSLFVFIFVYAFVGGLIFTKIETDATIERDAELQKLQHECIMQVSFMKKVNGILKCGV